MAAVTNAAILTASVLRSQRPCPAGPTPRCRPEAGEQHRRSDDDGDDGVTGTVSPTPNKSSGRKRQSAVGVEEIDGLKNLGCGGLVWYFNTVKRDELAPVPTIGRSPVLAYVLRYCHNNFQRGLKTLVMSQDP